MKVNRRQREILVGGIALLILTGLFLPWKETREQFVAVGSPTLLSTSLQYRSVFQEQPKDGTFIASDEQGGFIAGSRKYRLYWLVLVLEWVAVEILVGLGLWSFRKWAPTAAEKV